jgi:hypothetical protein
MAIASYRQQRITDPKITGSTGYENLATPKCLRFSFKEINKTSAEILLKLRFLGARIFKNKDLDFTAFPAKILATSLFKKNEDGIYTFRSWFENYSTYEKKRRAVIYVFNSRSSLDDEGKAALVRALFRLELSDKLTTLFNDKKFCECIRNYLFSQDFYFFPSKLFYGLITDPAPIPDSHLFFEVLLGTYRKYTGELKFCLPSHYDKLLVLASAIERQIYVDLGILKPLVDALCRKDLNHTQVLRLVEIVLGIDSGSKEVLNEGERSFSKDLPTILLTYFKIQGINPRELVSKYPELSKLLSNKSNCEL